MINKSLINILENVEINIIYSILLDLLVKHNGKPKDVVTLIIRCTLNLLYNFD